MTKEALVYKLEDGEFQSTNIDRIKRGDIILSHKNRPKKVLKNFCYKIEEDLIKISTFYSDLINPVILTKDHKIYLGDNIWREAKDITTKDWLVLPIPKIDNRDKTLSKLDGYIRESGKIYRDSTIELSSYLKR